MCVRVSPRVCDVCRVLFFFHQEFSDILSSRLIDSSLEFLIKSEIHLANSIFVFHQMRLLKFHRKTSSYFFFVLVGIRRYGYGFFSNAQKLIETQSLAWRVQSFAIWICWFTAAAHSSSLTDQQLCFFFRQRQSFYLAHISMHHSAKKMWRTSPKWQQ